MRSMRRGRVGFEEVHARIAITRLGHKPVARRIRRDTENQRGNVFRRGAFGEVAVHAILEKLMLWATLWQPRVPFNHSGVDIDLVQAGHQPQLLAEPLVEFRMHKNSVGPRAAVCAPV
jgi:hypothetical protein